MSDSRSAPSRRPASGLAGLLWREGRAFLLSLGFLTRLGPALTASNREMALACAYYPAVGATLGAVLVLPLYCGWPAGPGWAQAWLYVLLSVWLTRALHLDGLADLLDALGSGQKGGEFQAVLKDSRIGAFGCAGLCLALSGQIFLAGACLEEGRLAPLACAPIFGRCLPILLAGLAPANPEARLGALLARAPKVHSLLLAAAGLAGSLSCLSAAGLVAALPPALLCLCWLRRTALRQGGYNGDYCGFAVVAGELAFLLAASA